jgi:chromosome segregation ATPase
MEIQEAINIAQQVKSRYQAFEKLEEFLRYVSSLDNYEKEVNGRIDAAKAAEAEGKARLDSVNANIEQAHRDLSTLKESHERRSAELTDSHNQRATELQASYQQKQYDLEKDLAAKQTEAAGKISDLNAQIDSKVAEVADHHSRLEAIKAEIDAMKERAKGLFGT